MKIFGLLVKICRQKKKSQSPYLPTANQSRWGGKIKLPDFTTKRCLGILVYAEVTKFSLNWWFNLTVTKLNLSTNSLMTFIFFLIKLNSEVPMMSVLYVPSMVGENFWLDSPSPAHFLSSRCWIIVLAKVLTRI